jgi:hypothetical protein
MWVTEREIKLKPPQSARDWLTVLHEVASATLEDDGVLLRTIVTRSGPDTVFGEALVLSGTDGADRERYTKNFCLVQRPYENTSSFIAALIVPTGIGAEIGGHAGDAGPVVKLLASVCDSVITHPNVVNASDINEIPENSYYVEGSVLSRLLLGNIALQPVRKNRILVIIDEHPDECFTNAAINAVNAARATYGLECSDIIKLNHGVRLKVAYSASGRAAGEVSNLDVLVGILKTMRSKYDAIALSSVIDVPPGYHQKYFDAAGTMVNPWGGVEAMLTHTLSTLLDVPTAHSPMFETREVANSDPGPVDPRMAAEAVSVTFMQSVLKGLQRSPRIVKDVHLGQSGLLDVTGISCLVIPDGCIGVPTLAALAQGINVIAVKENRSLMQNDLRLLPWNLGQLHIVENYWEAAGVIAALKAGIDPASARRPVPFANAVSIDTEINLTSITSSDAGADVKISSG